MVKDRLAEFKMASNKQEIENDFETDKTTTNEKDWILTMETIIGGIKQIHRRILTSVYTDDTVQETLESLIVDMQNAALKLRNTLQRMQSEIETEAEMYKRNRKGYIENTDASNKDSDKSEPASLRMKRVQYTTLKLRFSVLMQEYNRAQLEYSDRCRERIRRQLHIMGRDVTEDELENLIEQPLGTAILGVVQTQQHIANLNDVEARHRDILKVEQSIREMKELFLNIAIVVEKQQEMVDHIEYNVNLAGDFVEKGNTDIGKAMKSKMKLRRRKVWLAVGVTLIVVVIIVLIAM